ncbi:MAG: hypothetical protein KBT01_07060 [Clostridiales bacterium]|nr:hypothetical protein [Candidatus Blautia equi]
MAPKMDARVTKAWNTFKFQILVDPSVKYSGYFDAKGQLITLNANQVTSFPDTIYHELGHFLAFIAGNVDTKADFKAIYTAEKGKLTGVSAAYAKQSSSEFFAECTRLYVVDNANLKKTCPKTYAAIQKALDSVTDTRIKLLQKTYGAYWK